MSGQSGKELDVKPEVKQGEALEAKRQRNHPGAAASRRKTRGQWAWSRGSPRRLSALAGDNATEQALTSCARGQGGRLRRTSTHVRKGKG